MIVGGAFGAGAGTESSALALGTRGIELGAAGPGGITMVGGGAGADDGAAEPPPGAFFFPGGMYVPFTVMHTSQYSST